MKIKILLFSLILFLGGCKSVTVIIQYKSNVGYDNKIEQSTDANAKFPIVGEENDK